MARIRGILSPYFVSNLSGLSVDRLQFFPRVVSKFSKWKRMKFSRGKLLDGRDMLFRKRYPFSRARFLERVRDGIF